MPSESAGLTTFHVPAVRGAGNRRRAFLGIIVLAVALALVVGAGRALWDVASQTDFAARNLAPSPAHPFGCDWMGRDMFGRTLAGLSTSVLVGLVAAACSSVVACALALVAALGGRAADAAVSWLIDLVMGVPHLILLLLISYALGRGVTGVAVGVALTHWPSLARVLRAEVMQLREQPWLAAARASGASAWHIAWGHVLPALVPQLLVGTVVAFPHAILHEASITFLGFGLPPELPAIGVILSESMQYLSAGYWWLAVLPGAALLAVVLAFADLGSLVRALTSARTVQE